MKHKEGDWSVSTIIHPLLGWLWETAVSRPEHGSGGPFAKYNWKPVERYDDEEAAKIGHDKWVGLMREDPHRRLPDV